MSFADSWYRASCALLLLTLHYSMFSFYLPLSFSLSLLLSLSLSLSFSLSLFISPPLSLCGCKTHVIWCPLRNILFLINLTFFHAKSCHSWYKLHQPFTDYFLRLPYSEMLEKRVFRSRANRRLVVFPMTFSGHHCVSVGLAEVKMTQLRQVSRTFFSAPLLGPLGRHWHRSIFVDRYLYIYMIYNYVYTYMWS